VSLLAAFGALALLAAGILGLVAPARTTAIRLIGALGAAALLPAVDAPAARPALGAALGAAALASPLPTLLAAAAALAASLRCLAEGPVDEGPGFALSLAAGAAVVATGACESAFAARPRSGDDPARAALAGGVLTVGALLWLGQGSLLRWTLALGDGAARLDLRGAALVLGTALLVSLLGALALGAHLLVPAVTWAHVLGRRALVLGVGLATLGLGLTVARGLDLRPEALAAGAGPLAGLTLAALILTAFLLILLGAPGGSVAGRAGLEDSLGPTLAVLALAAAGYEAWSGVGSYETPRTAAFGSAALFGLAALQPTRFALTRRTAFVAALVVLFL